MGARKLRDNFIKKDDLISLYKNKTEVKKLGKNDLCWKALDDKLITQEQCDASLERRTSTIPCYLHTHIQDLDVQKLIEKYVRYYSMMFSRGSYIANLIAMKELPRDHLSRTIPTTVFMTLPTFLTEETILKQCFLPERWSKNQVIDDLEVDPTKKIVKKAILDPMIRAVCDEYSSLLDPFLPTDYESLLCNTGWDNALNHMGSSYKGSIKVQILTHLPSRLSKYFGSYYKSKNGTKTGSLKYIISYPLRPSTELHNDDFLMVQSIRLALGVNAKDYLNKGFEDFTDYIWGLHFWLQQRLSKDEKGRSSTLPIASMNRKYAYLDHKILNSLLPLSFKKEMKKTTEKHYGSDLQKLMGLTSELFNQRLSQVRKKKRNKKDKKRKKKWKDRGRGSLPKNALINCISTDGVGLRLCVEFIPNRKIAQVPFILQENNYVLVGDDTGRVRLNTSVNSEGKVTMMTRKNYYYRQHDHRFKVWERSRMVNTPWGTLLAELADTGGLRNSCLATWIKFLDVQGRNMNVLLDEQMNIERAKIKMFRFRQKKSWMDKNMKHWLEPAHKRKKQMVIGVGDGKFASGGKGELSVPTSGIQMAFRKALKMLKIKRIVKVVSIDEHNTTKCCHKCDNVMDQIPCHGRHCQRYRLCTHCSPETNGKRRHRDVNAARNILRLLKLQVDGEERPQHLRCPWRTYVAFPLFERTA